MLFPLEEAGHFQATDQLCVWDETTEKCVEPGEGEEDTSCEGLYSAAFFSGLCMRFYESIMAGFPGLGFRGCIFQFTV